MRNILREKRQFEARKKITNSIVIDLGAGSFPISSYAIKIDRNPSKKPDIVATALFLPLRAISINCIFALEIIEHFHKKEQIDFLEEIKRILKPHGKLIITLPNYSLFMQIPQRIIWYLRERTTQIEYLHNAFTHTHIGIISPQILVTLLKKTGFNIIEEKRLMLYDYIIESKK